VKKTPAATPSQGSIAHEFDELTSERFLPRTQKTTKKEASNTAPPSPGPQAAQTAPAPGDADTGSDSIWDDFGTGQELILTQREETDRDRSSDAAVRTSGKKEASEVRSRSATANGSAAKPSAATPSATAAPKKAAEKSRVLEQSSTSAVRLRKTQPQIAKDDSERSRSSASGVSPVQPRPTAEIPADPGYDVLPADEPSPPADEPSLPAPRPRRHSWLTVLAATVALAGLAWFGFVIYEQYLQADSGSVSQAPSPEELAWLKADVAAHNDKRANATPPTPATETPDAAGPNPMAPGTTPPPSAAEQVVEIGIAYGTEKRNWLEWATQEFATTEAGRRIHVNLIPMGSLESAHAILDGDRRIHVWSPASSLYRETLVRDWEAKHGGNPILKEEALALTPMVLVMWKGRYEAYTARSPEVSLRTIRFAMHARNGWAMIAGRPEWGRFKFGHTHPNQSNSGLMTLIVLAYEFFGKTADVTVADIMSPEFQDYLTQFGQGVAGLSNSTGNLMKEMTLKGPTAYDALMVYESVAIDYLSSAQGRWEQLRVIYPKYNLWNENPYCILNTDWTTAEHQQAAETFLKFLMSDPIQARALDHGFRPGNPAVPVKGPESPFVRFAECGLSIELPEMCEVPSRQVIENLQQAWIRYGMPRTFGKR
jgi:hypothetical protein